MSSVRRKYLKQQKHEAHLLGGKMVLQLLPGRHRLVKPLRFEANHLPKHRGAYSIYFWAKYTPPLSSSSGSKNHALLRHGEEDNISLRPQAPHTVFVRHTMTPTEGAFPFPTHRWTHVALVRTHTGVLRVYINGKLLTQGRARQQQQQQPVPLVLGGEGFTGWVSHVEYANYALSQSELATVLNGGPLRAAITHLRNAFAQVGCTANPVPNVSNPYSDQWNMKWLPLAAEGRRQPLTQSLATFKTQADRAIVTRNQQQLQQAEKCYGRIDALNRVKLTTAMRESSHQFKTIKHQLNRISHQLAEIQRLKKLLSACKNNAAKIAQVRATLQHTKELPQLQAKLKKELAATQAIHRRDTQKLAQALTPPQQQQHTVLQRLLPAPPTPAPPKSLNQIQHTIDNNMAAIGTKIDTINRTINTANNKMSSAEMATLSNRIAVLRQNNLSAAF